MGDVAKTPRTVAEVVAELREMLALRDRFTREHGLAWLASDAHGEMLDRFAEEMPALLDCVTALESVTEHVETMRSYLGHQDQDADHAWMAEKMRQHLNVARRALATMRTR